MKRVAVVGLALAALVLLIAASLEAATYYVSPTGNDGNPGTEAQPFRSVVYGSSRLKPGDTLYLRAGTYAEALEHVPSGTSWAQKVRIASYPGETATLRPTFGSFVIYF